MRRAMRKVKKKKKQKHFWPLQYSERITLLHYARTQNRNRSSELQMSGRSRSTQSPRSRRLVVSVKKGCAFIIICVWTPVVRRETINHTLHEYAYSYKTQSMRRSPPGLLKKKKFFPSLPRRKYKLYTRPLTELVTVRRRGAIVKILYWPPPYCRFSLHVK